MKDYEITLQDSTGRLCSLAISADTVAEAGGDSEAVEGNAFQNAIARGLIGADAVLLSRGEE